MAAYFVDIGVDEGIGSKDGSDINNYMGWHQLSSAGWWQDGNTYKVRGMYNNGSWGGSSGLTSATTIQKWGTSPWRMNNAQDFGTANIEGAVIYGTVPLKGVLTNTFFNISDTNNTNPISNWSTTTGYGSTYLSPSGSITLADCSLLFQRNPGPGFFQFDQAYSGFTGILFNHCATREAQVFPAPGLFWSNPGAKYNGASTVAFGAAVPSAPAWDDAVLTHFDVTPGYGVGAAGGWAVSSGAPTFHISPTFYSFAGRPRGTTADATVTVSNTGTAALTMGAMTGLSAPFSVVNDFVSSSTMNSNGDSSTFVLQYSATTLGASSGTLTIPSNDSSSPYLFQVDGTSQAADISVSPAGVAFGLKAVNSSSTQTLTVTNTGNLNLVLQPVSALNAPFSVINDNVSDATIAPLGSATLSVVFNPRSLGEFQGTLVIDSNDPDTAALSVLVDGAAVEPVNVFLSSGARHDFRADGNKFEIRDFIS